MTMRGLYKSTGYWSTQAAWKDWDALVKKAKEAGWKDWSISEFSPSPTDGHRKVDKCIAKLREAMSRRTARESNDQPH
jgi:sugar phosphate isomerase/epimerase